MLSNKALKVLKKRSRNYIDNITIIGAGAAGMAAGLLLKKLQIPFQILEASSVYGGRLAKLTGFADYPIDLGAQWLHGKKRILGDWIDETKMEITHDRSKEVFWFQNNLVDQLPDTIDIFEDDDLPDVSFKDWAHENGLNADYNNIIEFMAGDLGASASKLSVYYNYTEFENWRTGSKDYKFKETFFDLIDRKLGQHLKDDILFDTPIKTIDYSNQKVKLIAEDGRNFEADKVIVTIPISVLKQGDVTFIPEIPNSKKQAFNKIGMDVGIKIFLKFAERFYKGVTLGGSVCAAYIDEQYGKSGTTPILLAYLMGDQAERLQLAGSEDDMITALLKELDTMYDGQASEHYLEAHIQDWGKMPYIKGAYSYSTIGMANARHVAAQPLSAKIFFAGEAMHANGHHQSVHGAIETGIRAVKEVVR